MTFFYSLLYLAVNCSTLFVLEKYLVGFFLEIISGMFPYVTLLGSTVDTRLASVYEAFGRISRSSCVSHDTIYELCLPSERGFGFGMDLADPVSSGKYSWIFVFTAPVAELTVVSFTVLLNGWTIAATAAVVTSCSSSAVCPAVGCLRRDVVLWWIFPS